MKNNIQQHYDKLTNNERFSLLLAAAAREDIAERGKILQATPRKRWEVHTTFGLGNAFDWLAMWHMMQQLGQGAALYYLLYNDDLAADQAKETIELLQRRILETRKAWQIVCAEYGADPAQLLDGLPFIELYNQIGRTAETMQIDNPQELADLPENIEALRAAVEIKRKEWE